MAGPLTHEEEYRGKDAVARLGAFNVVVLGAGALGSNLVDTLVRQGVRFVEVIDDDRVEEHNLGTQIYGRNDIGLLKVNALQARVFEAMGIEVVGVSKRLDAQNVRKLVKKADLIIDCFDNSESRQVVQDEARRSGKDCLHAGLFENYGEVVWDERYRVPPNAGGDVCDYPLARNIIMLTVAVAADCVVDFLTRGVKRSFAITLRDMTISEL